MQFQGVLWPLLGAALDVSSIESETMVEEGLRLLSAVLGCTAELPPQLLVPPLPLHIPAQHALGMLRL